MKKLIAIIALALVSVNAHADKMKLMWNPNTFGNICKIGELKAYVDWAPVGSECYSRHFRAKGIIVIY